MAQHGAPKKCHGAPNSKKNSFLWFDSKNACVFPEINYFISKKLFLAQHSVPKRYHGAPKSCHGAPKSKKKNVWFDSKYACVFPEINWFI